MQEKIRYDEVMKLGFKEEYSNCDVFKRQHGFDYSVIWIKLARKVKIEYDKLEQTARMFRTVRGHIVNERPIKNLEHLTDLVNFFKGESECQ